MKSPCRSPTADPDRDRDSRPTFLSSPPFIILALLMLSLPLLFLLAPRLLPPDAPTLPPIPDRDDLDDLSLFRRAVLDSSPPSDPRRRPNPRPKIAFMFLTTSDLALAPLWERFFANNQHLFNVYVHTSPSATIHSPPTPSFAGRFIPSKSTSRASPTLISAARRLLAAALLDDPANAYFALLSESCVPLHSFRFTYRALFNDPGASAGPFRPRRHRSFIEVLANEPSLQDRYVARGEGVMMPEVPFESFRIGSQFFVLTRRHAVAVVSDTKLWKKFKLPCLKKNEDTCYPEEHYFPTLLDMTDSEGLSGYTLTRVNWTDSVGGHPRTYEPNEISGELIRELRRSNSSHSYLFARKFLPDTLSPLLEIADSVIFRD